MTEPWPNARNQVLSIALPRRSSGVRACPMDRRRFSRVTADQIVEPPGQVRVCRSALP